MSVALLTGIASVASFSAKNRSYHSTMLTGCAVLVIGPGLTACAVALDNIVLFYISTGIAGIGFGLAFSGAFRSLVALARPTERSALIAATYVIGYTAFAVPAIAAGIVTTHIGLRPTAIGYSLAVVTLALVALIATRSKNVE